MAGGPNGRLAQLEGTRDAGMGGSIRTIPDHDARRGDQGIANRFFVPTTSR